MSGSGGGSDRSYRDLSAGEREAYDGLAALVTKGRAERIRLGVIVRSTRRCSAAERARVARRVLWLEHEGDAAKRAMLAMLGRDAFVLESHRGHTFERGGDPPKPNRRERDPNRDAPGGSWNHSGR